MGARSRSPAAPPLRRQYLVTDEGFCRQLALNLAVLLCLVGACLHVQPLYEVGFEAYGWLSEQMMRGAHRMAWWSLLGLLSSSCCALQILLNAFSFGCAGFNTTLGPLRPTFVALTLTMQALAWHVAYPRPWQWAPTAASTAVATVLTLLPEALATHTAWRQQVSGVGGGPAHLQFRLSTLGCAACVSKVSGVLDGIEEVASHEVSLETGLARVALKPPLQGGEAGAGRRVVAKVEAAGFPASDVVTADDDQRPAATDDDTQQQNDDTQQQNGDTQQQNDDTQQSGDTQQSQKATEENSGAGKAAEWARLNSAASAVVAGLLSSSCCLLQLALNALAMLNVAHIGCAGFNKVLGPWRPQLRAATLGWLAMMWVLSVRRRWPKLPLLCSSALALGLAWLPEILLFLGETGGGVFSLFSGVAPDFDGAELLQLKVNGMGCEACQLHVRTTLEMSAGVLSSRVDWEGGTAEVWVNPSWGFNLTDLSARLEYDGYEISPGAAGVAAGEGEKQEL